MGRSTARGPSQGRGATWAVRLRVAAAAIVCVFNGAAACSSSSDVGDGDAGEGARGEAGVVDAGVLDSASSNDAAPTRVDWNARCRERLEATPPPPPRGLGARVHGSLFSVPHSDYCGGAGTPVAPPAGSDIADEQAAQCTSRLAARWFRFGFCICGSLTTNGDLVTDAFDSLGESSLDSGSAVGANGDHSTNGRIDLTGSLLVAGCGGVTCNSAMGATIRGDVRTRGTIKGIGEYRIVRDLQLGIPWRGSEIYPVFVGRDYIVPPGAEVPDSIHVERDVLFRDETLDYPCDCDGSILPDPTDAVAQAATRNDNELLGYDPTSASGGTTAGARVTFECGRYYFPPGTGARAIHRSGDTVLESNGRVSLFLDGTLAVSGDLRIEARGGRLELFVAEDLLVNGTLEIVPDETSEVDVFVAGNLTANGFGDIGARDRARNIRVYVSEHIIFNGGARLVGNYFAAETIVFNGEVELWGALLGSRYVSNGATTIHYDRAILRAGEQCQPGDDVPCSSNDECDEFSACVEGRCGACRADEDCSAPLVCTDGRCESLLF